MKISQNKFTQIIAKAKQLLINSKMKKLPIRLQEIANKQGWLLVPYSKLEKSCLRKYINYSSNNKGFCLCMENKFLIFYNDALPKKQQRFVIAHEMGHIALRHYIKKQKNREQEANMFARQVLVPLFLLNQYHIKSKKQISKKCIVNYCCAKTVYFENHFFKKINI